MRAPSLTRLEYTFPGKGKELRALLEGEVHTCAYKSVQDLIARCYNKPDYPYRLMTALNEIIGGHGIERIECNGKPIVEYVNRGCPHMITIVRKIKTGNIILTGWADFAESNRMQGR